MLRKIYFGSKSLMMKKFLFLLIVLLPALCGCGNDDDGVVREEIITVASETRLISSAISHCSAMLIKKNNDDKWAYLRAGINNLPYEEGYEYRLRVRITKNEYPKDAVVDEWSSDTYTCLEVLSKVKKNSVNMPEEDDWSILSFGSYMFKVCLRTPSGNNLLDSLDVATGNMTSYLYGEELAAQLFDVSITKQSDGTPVSSDEILCRIGRDTDAGAYLEVMFRDRNFSASDEKYETKIVCKPNVWNTTPCRVDWYVRRGAEFGYDAYKCEVNGSEYPLENDKLYTKYVKSNGHWLFALLTIDL